MDNSRILLFAEFDLMKKKCCEGCVYDSPSQKDHSCLYDYDDDFLMEQTLNYLLKEKRISDEEYLNLMIENNLV
jgi:hypothetical protein